MSFESKNIRNVVLLGHSGCGKTTFAETMLFEAKEIPRRGTIDSGSTVSDYTNIEKEKKNSIFSTLLHAKWKDSKINIIDTPGLDDFVGEVISSLKVADTGVMMLNATAGVEVGTEILWEYTLRNNTPTIFVVNQVDHEKSDFESTLEQAVSRFGSKVIPFQYPLNQGYGFDAIVDALRMVMYVFPIGGGRPEKKAIPEGELKRAKEMHSALVESAAENDEALMEKYFEVGTLNESELAEGLRLALAGQQIFPLFCCSSLMNKGSGRIMGFINDICPSPADRPDAALENGDKLLCNSSEEPIVFIYKTMSEPQVGMVSYFKVYSGTIRTGDELFNRESRSSERISQISISNGKQRDQVNELRAGDLGLTLKLKDSHSNNTLAKKGDQRMIEKIHFPNARIRAAIKPAGKNDMVKLMKALHTIEEEDPTLIIEQSRELRQTILHAQGQLHMDIIKYRIEKVNGINMEFERPKIPYRETIQKISEDSYRLKKQSGGSGQFGEVHMRIEPYFEGMSEPHGLNIRSKEIEELPWGGKIAFYWCIVGGAIDSKFSNAIKKGVMSKMEEGPLTGSYCQDVRVCIFDGKMHAVDSNDMAFMIASTMVFKSNFEKANPQLLEPLYDLEILCSDLVLGDVMSDLQTRRAIIQGMDTEGHYQKIIARVPLAEMYRYSSSLRSLTQGRAKFMRSFAEYAPVPHEIQKELISNYKKEYESA